MGLLTTQSGRGLSPRVRGNLLHFQQQVARAGSIPACAGEPSVSKGVGICFQVYPRVCGGTAAGDYGEGAPAGLSPRVRGNLVSAILSLTAERSIPACAGEPPRPRKPGRGWRVYPRVCGGTAGQGKLAHRRHGLSPRVRGNQIRQNRYNRRPGSIPACAGEPIAFARPVGMGWVYPRVCGGTPRPNTANGKGAGLSPRVRGNLAKGGPDCRDNRSIPACAGEPPQVTTAKGRPQVYPRVCGGTLWAAWADQ